MQAEVATDLLHAAVQVLVAGTECSSSAVSALRPVLPSCVAAAVGCRHLPQRWVCHSRSNFALQTLSSADLHCVHPKDPVSTSHQASCVTNVLPMKLTCKLLRSRGQRRNPACFLEGATFTGCCPQVAGSSSQGCSRHADSAEAGQG